MIIKPINKKADRKYFNNWLRSNYEFNAIMYLEDRVNIVFETEPSDSVQDTIVDKYTSLSEVEITSYEVVKAYQKKSQDGTEFFEEQRAGLFIKLSTGQITIEGAFLIEEKLRVVKSLLTTGDWLTAKNQMLSITPEGEYSEEVHNFVKGYIDSYVQSNY
jgi:hypothetical protein